MRVILAGATGVIGRPLAAALAAAGHQVIAITRNPVAVSRQRDVWADVIVADVLDRDRLLAAAQGIQADAVVHQLTALSGIPYTYRDLRRTNRLRTDGTRHLLSLAEAVGATRLVTQSFLGGYGYSDHAPWLRHQGRALLDEDDPFGVPGRHVELTAVTAALEEAERLTLTTAGIEGVALRYGLFYGAGGPLELLTPLLRRRQLPLPRHGGGTHSYIWLPDAAAATVAALHEGIAGQAYNICDDHPLPWNSFFDLVAATIDAPRPLRLPRWVFRPARYAYDVMTSTIPLANRKAKQELHWRPMAPTVADGLRLDRLGAAA